ncbi:amidase domain-containing protein [Paenibacillus nasutitermitis]|uniref:Exported protein n=1 Tax=Paenibacillus nasutitermitis TaxID=1652958 RepID=A0A916Z5A2_9BACL|nr:amidase domain-containing protein [Paenibacillus nasutitermitis]GGD77417.1 exported protein [Paenibacillus nasutitermitis]
MLRLFLLAGMSIVIAFAPITGYDSSSQGSDKEEITRFLSQLYNDRNTFLIHPHPETIEKYYIKTEGASRYAYQMELRRATYLNSWAEKRNIRLISTEPNIRLGRLKKDGDEAKVTLVQSVRISYQYKSSQLPSQSFGVGTRHALTLKKENNRWVVKKEWYLDPLEENADLISDTPDGFPHPSSAAPKEKEEGRYNRERAVTYANKYAGLAWGAGNKNRYNRKYKDFTPLGGDCTNFTSQVLGDAKEGGGLRTTNVWRGGSKAWVQTDAFEHFLRYSGYGRLIAKGTFTDITRSNEKHPDGAIAELLPGDVIGYSIKGDTDHFSIIVGHDANGYPLVNSHTADRYRVPFDLGWDKHTKYLLVHINN